MCGMNDLGGVKFFTITLDTPNGDMKLMDAVLEGGYYLPRPRTACSCCGRARMHDVGAMQQPPPSTYSAPS
jgi:hypothetical protein